MRAHPEWEVLNRGMNGERSDADPGSLRSRRDRGASARQSVIIAGVNDVYQGRAVEEIEANLAGSCMLARATCGIRVVAGTIIPYDTATPEQNEKMRQINAWIRQQATASMMSAVAETRRRGRVSDRIRIA